MSVPRALNSFADGERFAIGCGMYLENDAAMCLIPEITCLEYRGLTENDLSLLSEARIVEIRFPDGGFLCGGTPDNIETVSRGGVRVTSVTLVANPDFYRVPVSLTVRAGTTVRELLSGLLRPAGMSAPALPEGFDTVLPRPRSFCCAVSEAVDDVMAELGASACLRQGRLFVRPALTGRAAAALAEPASLLPGDTYNGRLVTRRTLALDTSGSVWRMKLEVE